MLEWIFHMFKVNNLEPVLQMLAASSLIHWGVCLCPILLKSVPEKLCLKLNV